MLNRRHVLKGLGGLAVTPMFFRSMSAEAATGSSTIVVAILLEGGNDGLNTVVPLQQYGIYNSLRTPSSPPPGMALAYSQSDLAPLAFNTNPNVAASQSTQFAFTPGMDAMRSLYATGHLAVIAGVGLPAAETSPMSHYNAQQDWMTGQINGAGAGSGGWLGMTLANAPGGTLGPVASMSGSSDLIVTAASQGLVLPSPIDGFGLSYGNSDNYYGLVSTFGTIMDQKGQSSSATYAQGVMNAAMGDVKTVTAIASAQPCADYPTPTTALDYQLRDIARMILGGSGVRGYAVVQPGYDTHADQANFLPALLSNLSAAMSNFYTYLQSKGASSNVVVMTLSDFGRRPAANLDFGTDHGGANVGFVLGDQVDGGVFGTYPNLTQLDQNQNLAMNVDFRNVISDVIQAMGGNPTPILGETYPRLGFI